MIPLAFVGVGVAIATVVGMAWYSPALFGSTWMAYVYPGKTGEQVGIAQGSSLGTTLAANSVMMVLLHYLYK